MVQLTFGIVTVLIVVASFLLQVFGVVTPWWGYINPRYSSYTSYHSFYYMYYSSSDRNYGPFYGLWQRCESSSTGEHYCVPLDLVSDRVQWVRTVEVLALISAGVAIVCGIAKEVSLKQNRNLLKIGAASCFMAGALMITGLSIYGAVLADELRIYPHASFGLCFLATIAVSVSGGMHVCWWYKIDSNRVHQVALEPMSA